MSAICAGEILSHLTVRHHHLARFAFARQRIAHELLHRPHLIDAFAVTGKFDRTMMTTRTLFVFLVFYPEDLHMRDEPNRGTEQPDNNG